MDPSTGLPQGEEIDLAPDKMKLVEAIQQARDCMTAGDLEAAVIAERKAMDMFKSMETLVDARALGLPDAFQVNAADFLEPHSTPSDDELEATFAYAREHAELTTHDMRYQVIGNVMGNTGYPGNVSAVIMWGIWLERSKLEQKHKEDHHHRHAQEDDEMENDEEEEESHKFQMDDRAWEAIEKAVRNRVVHSKSVHEAELNPPQPHSAPIARYNPAGHFTFKSEKANASVDGLVDSLCCGSLLSRPSERCSPFEITCQC